MDPVALIPTPDALPVHWTWFQFLFLLTFFFHIILMNVMLGTIIIAFVRHAHRPKASELLTREISGKLPFAIALAVNFGVAPLLFLQVLYGHFIYTSSVLMAALWLSIIGILIAAYYTAYIYRYQYDTMRDNRMIAAGLISGLLLVIGFLFSNNYSLMVHPQTWQRYFSHPSALLLNFSDPSLIPRYLHFVLSALAVGGLAIALYFRQKQKKGAPEVETWIRYGCNWFGYATFANFAVGFWFFGTLPHAMLAPSSLIGALFAILLIIGVSSALLAAIYGLRLRVMPALYLLLGSIFCMILVRELVQLATLQPWFSPTDLQVTPSYSPLFLFLIFFVCGLILIGWMLKITWQTYQDREVRS